MIGKNLEYFQLKQIDHVIFQLPKSLKCRKAENTGCSTSAVGILCSHFHLGAHSKVSKKPLFKEYLKLDKAWTENPVCMLKLKQNVKMLMQLLQCSPYFACLDTPDTPYQKP